MVTVGPAPSRFHPGRPDSPKQGSHAAGFSSFACAGLLLLIAGAFASHHAGLLRDAIPALLPLYGFALLRQKQPRYDSQYYGLLLAAWFFTPMLRRLVDASAGFVDPNPMLLAPYLVALAAPAAHLRSLVGASLRTIAPYGAAMLAMALAVIGGVFHYPVNSVGHGLVQWATPVLFAAYLRTSGQQRPFREGLNHWLPSLLVLAALYTVLQFCFAFPWDMAWLVNLDLPSMGGTDPFAIRAFGPLNSAGTAAFLFSAGSLYLLHTRLRWRLPAFALTAAALLTTEVRAGWLAFAIGMVLSLALAPRRSAAAAGGVVLAAAALFTLGLSGSVANIADRMQTFSQPSDDVSAQGRLTGYGAAWYYLEANPLGTGLGVPEDFFDVEGDFSLMDSGPVAIFVTFGVLGGAAYVAGLWMLLLPALRLLTRRPEGAVLQAVIPAVALLGILMLGSVIVDLPGLLIWSLLSTPTAGAACALPRSARERGFAARRTPLVLGDAR